MADVNDVLKGVTNKDLRVVLRKAVKAGCIIEWARGRSLHVHVKCPNGGLVIASGTPSSPHSARYLKNDLRRNGVEL